MREEKLKIHSENILPIIKKWLYSEKDIFVRELVSNACDATFKLNTLMQNEHKTFVNETNKIEITIDKEKRQLIFSDYGVGMDAHEVEKYIAQIAFSGAEDFLKKYKQDDQKDQIIGHFGLGFYSAYMVAEKVEIQTRSYKSDAEPVFWSCDGSSTYLIEKGTREKVGTDIILTIAEGEDEFLDPANLRNILQRFCSFLAYPIFFNGSCINPTQPLWVKNPTECAEKEYLDFYKHLYPFEEEPLFWIHLNIDYPFRLKGILYFPKLAKEQDFKKETIRLFCNRVFVADNCRDILPEYLSVLRGALDSIDLPLNVSRSTLQIDKNVRQLGIHISKKIADRLNALYRGEKDRFLSYWKDLEVFVKFGILQDEKFYEKAKEFLIWETTEKEWFTIEDLKEKTGKTQFYYTITENFQAPYLDLYQKKGIPVLRIHSSLLDQAVFQFLERKTNCNFKRIDAALEDHLLDPTNEKTLLDAEGKTEASKIADFFQKKLGLDFLEVEAKSLATPSLPAMIMIKEEERRLRDHFMHQRKEEAASFKKFVKPTFVINTNSKLIQAICDVDKNDPELAKEMVEEIYDLTCLAHKEMELETLPKFITRSTKVLETLATRLIKEKTE